MARVKDESSRFVCPNFANIFIVSNSLKCLEPSCKVISINKQLEMYFKRLMAVIVIMIDRSLLDRAVHPFNLPISPGRVDFSQTMFTTHSVTFQTPMQTRTTQMRNRWL